jgi:hypothetical protein
LTQEQINTEIERLCDVGHDAPFIAIGTTYDEFNGLLEGYHSSIILCCDDRIHILHFNNGIVEFCELPENERRDYYIKRLNYLCPGDGEIEAFYVFCKKIQENSNIKYGFIFDGGFYNAITGEYFSNAEMPEISTCVGFCVNVLTGWIYDIEEYFAYEEWELLPIENPAFQRHFNIAVIHFPELDISDYQRHHRRISPDDFMLSGFFEIHDMAIKKFRIDQERENYTRVIQMFRNN